MRCLENGFIELENKVLTKRVKNFKDNEKKYFDALCLFILIKSERARMDLEKRIENDKYNKFRGVYRKW